jgi:hypothetical protein
MPSTYRPTYDWKLLSTGPERLPRVVYLRFTVNSPTPTSPVASAGGVSPTQNFTDDIILDETAPEIQDVSASSGGSKVAQAKSGSVKVKIKASDKTSGVEDMQVTDKKSNGKWVRYRQTAKLKTSSSKVYVRVRDAAGNESRWAKGTIAD